MNLKTVPGLIEAFVNGKEKGTSGSITIKGDVLYSYTTPIAKREGDKVRLTTRKFSPTTSTHQNYVRKYTPKNLLVEVFLLEDK